MADDAQTQRKIVDETARRIPAMDLSRPPAELMLPAYNLATEITANADPYRELRRIQNESALAIEPELRALIQASSDPLSTALHLAAAGNIIDLGVASNDDIDIHGAIEQAMHEKFAVDHTEAFRESLSAAADIVYLLDNEGEIVFDKILIEQLLEQAPVTAVVKGGPIINDAILADAEQVGLTRVCPVIDNGGAFIGSPLELVPRAFLARLEKADMIVCKGQGNYETVDAFPGNVFFILKAKCKIIAQHMGVRLGQVGLVSSRVRSNA